MREEREGIQCVFAFGKDAADAQRVASEAKAIDDTQFNRLNNPLPTGDHWKVIGWVTDHLKKGDSTLAKVPQLRRDFIKKGSEALRADQGFSLEVVSMAARRFRDQNDLRMQRGKVYIFVSKLPAPIEEQVGE